MKLVGSLARVAYGLDGPLHHLLDEGPAPRSSRLGFAVVRRRVRLHLGGGSRCRAAVACASTRVENVAQVEAGFGVLLHTERGLAQRPPQTHSPRAVASRGSEWVASSNEAVRPEAFKR